MPKTYKELLCLMIICNLMQFSHCLNFTNDLEKLKAILSDITEYVKLAVDDDQSRCVQMQCKFVCFNGKIGEIVSDIHKAEATTNEICPLVDELCIYNYIFPNNRIYRDFLGEYGSKVKKLYIATSNVIDVEGGAFANGIFTKLSFEKLKLTELRKDFFEGISSSFQALAVIQKDIPISTVNDDFLDYVKYQIKALTMQVGITCVRNLTASANLLNNLQTVDFSFNDFSSGLLSTTFSKLSVVAELDLSDSHISQLPENIFADVLTKLELLDLSNNELTTISSNIFSWRPIPRELKIIVSNNSWDCNCELKLQMEIVFMYQSSTKIFCSTPERYANASVYDSRLCGMDVSGEAPLGEVNYTTTTTASAHTTTTCKKCVEDLGNGASNIPSTTTAVGTVKTTPIFVPTKDPFDLTIAQLECFAASTNLREPTIQIVKRPTLVFDIKTRPSLIVDVLISADGLDSSYGLIWFSKVTKQYYKMEINYNEYGLGCYNSVSVITTVENLLPDVAYTFCLVAKEQLTISPFNCKSIHVHGNLRISYSAWLTKDMRATGISMIVIGIVIFVFVGILMVFLTLKRKPTLLKGSKRVAKTNGSSGEIIVFPKDKTIEDFRQKEQMLAKRNSKSTIDSCRRRNSTESIDSNQSYMNANLYEVIPAYLKLHEDQFAYKEFNIYQSTMDQFDSYILPLTTTSSAENLVRYAEIPSRAKRISNDPLPEVPREETPPALPLSECPDRMEDLSVEYIITLDNEVESFSMIY